MDIKITGAADARDGYGEITQNLSLALDKLGHKVEVNPVKIWYNKDSLKPRTLELIRPINPDYELIIMYPTYNFNKIYKNAGIITMYEANKCPNIWVKKLNGFKFPIFAPSQFVADMFKNSGVKSPIEVLTLGVNTSYYKHLVRFFPKERPFRFLIVGKLEPRKNVEVAIKCFQSVFVDENVEFIIKTRERFIPSGIKKSVKEDSRIKLIEKTISEEDLRELYYYCDAFIYTSRGEGFAFPPRNAISTGMPTIVTDWSALAEIPGAIKIPITGLSSMPSCGFSYGQEKELLMADIDEDNLMKEMYSLATDEEYYNKVAKEVYKVKQKTWEECGRAFVEMISK